MKKDARHHPIIEERFNDLMLTIIEIKLYWERPSTEGVALYGFLRDTVRT